MQLTNIHRTQAGLLPLRIGTSPAPQLHAQAALDGCYNSHWDAWGLRPGHRHALAGRTGFTLENIIGLNHCVKPEDGYAPLKPLQQEVDNALQAWMNSPGHQAAILNPSVTTLHIGLASNSHNITVVQHFEAEYVEYQQQPSINDAGTLTMNGTVDGATINKDRPAAFRIGYEPPPTPTQPGPASQDLLPLHPNGDSEDRPPQSLIPPASATSNTMSKPQPASTRPRPIRLHLPPQTPPIQTTSGP